MTIPSAGLGRPGTTTTALGFGCSAIAGLNTRRESLGLLAAAVELGIRHFDVARSVRVRRRGGDPWRLPRHDKRALHGHLEVRDRCCRRLRLAGPAHEGARPCGAAQGPGPLRGGAVAGDCQCARGAVRSRADTAEPRDEPSRAEARPSRGVPPPRVHPRRVGLRVGPRGPVGPRRLRSNRVRRPGDEHRRHPGDPRARVPCRPPRPVPRRRRHVRRRGDRARSTPWYEHDHPRGPRPEPEGVAGSPCRSERTGAPGVVGPTRRRRDRRERARRVCSCAVP